MSPWRNQSAPQQTARNAGHRTYWQGFAAGDTGPSSPDQGSERSRPHGFTLIEMLVAMAIVAIIGVMALGGLNQVIKQRDIAKAHADRWREIQFAVRLIVQDLAQIQPRPTRDARGENFRPAVLASLDGLNLLEFSRGGWSNPAGFARGTVLRVAYRQQANTLERLYWPVMDRTLATRPVKTDLLTGVQSVRIRFLDANRQWHAAWPPLDLSGKSALVTPPRAIEITLQLDDLGTIRRIVETRG